MRNLILSAALVSASLFGMTAQAADVPLEAGKTYVELANPVPVATRRTAQESPSPASRTWAASIRSTWPSSSPTSVKATAPTMAMP